MSVFYVQLLIHKLNKNGKSDNLKMSRQLDGNFAAKYEHEKVGTLSVMMLMLVLMLHMHNVPNLNSNSEL